MNTVIIKGNIVHTPTMDKFECFSDSYLITENNSVVGVFKDLPEKYQGHSIDDFGDSLVVPGFCDLHVHAPQFVFRGLGLDMQLMDWLNTYTFPTENKFSDLSFAANYYEAFANALEVNGTTSAVIFATIHVDSTVLLMDILEKHKIRSFVGKVNMDTLCPDYLCEDTKKSLEDAERWINEVLNKYKFVKPIVTPRFIPTCSSDLLYGVGQIAKQYGLKIQSHCSEDLGQIELSRKRYPDINSDGEVYDSFGLFNDNTVMAHFIFPTEEEVKLAKENGVHIAYCPQSHGNVRAGVSRIRRLLNNGIKVGLGSDIAAGYSVSMFRAMSDAEYMSKINWIETNREDDYLSSSESFYMATKGGAQFFGNVGSFESGYELDALVLDDANISTSMDMLTLEERIERLIHIGDDRNVVARYVMGERA